jgi:hypothetical protein
MPNQAITSLNTKHQSPITNNTESINNKNSEKK